MTLVTVAAICAGAGALLSGIAAVVSLATRDHVRRLDKSVNGRVDQLVASTSSIAHAAGVIEGHAAGVTEQRDTAS